MTKSNQFLIIDIAGNIGKDSQQIKDLEQIEEILSNIFVDDFKVLRTKYKNNEFIIEAFDEPLIVKSVIASGTFTWKAIAQFDHEVEFSIEELSLDEWDRYHGITTKGVPFILAGNAQNELFNQLESFDDDSITYLKKHIQNKDWLVKDPDRDVDEDQFWSDVYNRDEKPHWDLQEHSNPLADTLNQLKLTKSRVAVLGCGSGHDAAYFAKLGHQVTAFDFSEEAIKEAKENYGTIKNLEFVQKDVFTLAKDYQNSFDIVFEHTCYCAVAPKRRNELTKVWNSILAEKGHFLGVMFTLNKHDGPPFGGSEWEIKKRLSKYFEFRYWTRWRNSQANRTGFELIVYGEKKQAQI